VYTVRKRLGNPRSNKVRYIDISIPSGLDTTVYPGDPLPLLSWPSTHARGDAANVGVYHGCLHHGTHGDAPWHFVAGGKRLDEVPLDRWVGPCWVADLSDQAEQVTAAALEAARIPAETRRLLLKTCNSRSDYWRQPFGPDFVFLHPSAAEWCVARGLWTLGIDYLSPDAPQDDTFFCHRTLLGHGVVLLENLMLRDVDAGLYELLAAPVKLVGVDGAWCRALLQIAQ
jgi:arylformamidase